MNTDKLAQVAYDEYNGSPSSWKVCTPEHKELWKRVVTAVLEHDPATDYEKLEAAQKHLSEASELIKDLSQEAFERLSALTEDYLDFCLHDVSETKKLLEGK